MYDEPRIRELVALIGSERDPQKVKFLAAELERLLTVTCKPWAPQEKRKVS